MILQINEETKEGKSLVSFLQELAKKNTFIQFIGDKDIEELEDKEFGKLIKKTKTGDILSENQKSDFIKKLKAEAK